MPCAGNSASHIFREPVGRNLIRGCCNATMHSHRTAHVMCLLCRSWRIDEMLASQTSGERVVSRLASAGVAGHLGELGFNLFHL